jgi:hypothetical protein
VRREFKVALFLREPPLINRRVHILVLFVMALVVALPTTTRVTVPLLAGSLSAILAAFPAAVAPDRGGHNLQSLDRCNRVITGDDEITGPWIFFRGFVTYDNAQARPRMQRCREGIVDQLPMAVLVFERDARNI